MKWLSKEWREWLDSLEVGDEVAYNANNSGGQPDWVITTIIKITPTRQIVTSSGHRWRKGEYHTTAFDWKHIQPLNDEIKQHEKDHAVLTELQTTNWSNVPTNKRNQIYDILKGKS